VRDDDAPRLRRRVRGGGQQALQDFQRLSIESKRLVGVARLAARDQTVGQLQLRGGQEPLVGRGDRRAGAVRRQAASSACRARGRAAVRVPWISSKSARSW
jgi:hypothetical protein